jgi:hypothetical protein
VALAIWHFGQIEKKWELKMAEPAFSTEGLGAGK